MLIKRNIKTIIKNSLFKLKEIKWFGLSFVVIVFLAFPILKDQLEKTYGVNTETLNMIMSFMLIFYPFLNSVLVTVVSRGMFEEAGNELLYFYQKLSSHIYITFTLTILICLNSFFILANNYGFLYIEYIKVIFLSCFLSGISILLLTVTKTAVPSLLLLVSFLAYAYFNGNFIFDIAGTIGEPISNLSYILCIVGLLTSTFSILFYKKIPAYK